MSEGCLGERGGSMDQAWVVAMDMAYKHQRGDYPFREILYEG